MLAPHLLAFTPVLSTILQDMFHPDVPIIEKVVRTVLVYFALMLGLRISGKRELAQLNPFDLIVLLMLSNTVQNAIIGNDNSVTGGIIGATTLLALNYLIVRTVYRSAWLQRLVGGEPDVLVHHGKVRLHHLERELITREELEAACHREGIASLADVEKCILEPTGTLSFIERKPTSEDMRHQQLLRRLDQIAQEISSIKGQGSATPGGAG
jgi:uncharacterized membrane protein YcaP (DUF421 family)